MPPKPTAIPKPTTEGEQFDIPRKNTLSYQPTHLGHNSPLPYIPTSSAKTHDPSGTLKLAFIMVGLPARGKTYVARKITRYLTWLGYPARIFNVGNYRRDTVGAAQPHDFFDPNNQENAQKRMQVAMTALDDMIRWFERSEDEDELSDQGSSIKEDEREDQDPEYDFEAKVAIYDATNSTKMRRRILMDWCAARNIKCVFIEMVCEDSEMVTHNVKEVKISSPDYVGVDPELAVNDFMLRIKHYEKSYETVTEDENNGKISYIKLINTGAQVIVNKVQGYLQSRVVYFLMNLNITPMDLYFCRHGESVYNTIGRIGGDSDLSWRGYMFSQKLPELMEKQIGAKKLTIWTSTLKRTIQTASNFKHPTVQWKILDELDSGLCEGLTYEEIEERYPEDYQERDNDKFNFRYRGGESYRDLVQRLEPVIMELERHHEPDHAILIIGHQAVIRAIYSYFLNYSHDELPYVKIPLHTVIKLTPKAYGCLEERFPVDVPAVDTHRNKGQSAASVTKAARDSAGDLTKLALE
ncbi:histidine phosphatase superfamily [Polychytrium aggregatum]|uniref:histidine phosphatase superfamily n=1 Tax=Polychytrium aggregatum TaxID=110093 RepID=UPI0022FE23A6|nr:histidine phosphatase superfamily [Polychytrium aggregatum]KAI9207001.1 histidine phosphatase superfamily [Polychytrium aggregatum]